MKKIVYSPILKAIVVLLCISAVGFGAGWFSQVIVISNSYNVFSQDLHSDNDFARDLAIEWQCVINRIEDEDFDGISIDDSNIEYYLSIPSQGIEMGTPGLEFDGDADYGGIYIAGGAHEINLPHLISADNEKDVDFTIIMKYKQEYVTKYTTSVNIAGAKIADAVKAALALGIATILLCVYLAFVCGRRAQDNDVHLLLQDRVFPEVQLGAGIAAGVLITIGTIYLMDELYPENDVLNGMYYMQLAGGVGAAAVMSLIIAVFTSLLRMTKARRFLHNCLCYKIIVFAWKWFKRILVFLWGIVKRICRLSIRILKKIWGKIDECRGGVHRFFDSIITYKSSKAAVGIIILLAAICTILGMTQSFGGVVIAALLCAFLLAKVVLITRDLEKISAAIKNMRSGNLECDVNAAESKYFTELAESLNSIGSGMKAAVEKTVAAERMKTELITNVSHDLKTPLTSIISYSDLLCDMKLTPEEANDYAQIIRRKGDRLKNLTQDLFEVSKVQSGNEAVDWERLDLSLLVSQSLGEADAGLKNTELSTVVSIEKELFINADGKKLSRVFANLIGNIEKYAQKNTRVFITVKKQANRVRAEFKNTSALPLDFDTEEITERFVRGDKSRSTEGSGLGLAIAKSYTELCGGTFKIETDGDLFKVIVVFPIAE